jgi:hypothetical protein
MSKKAASAMAKTAPKHSGLRETDRMLTGTPKVPSGLDRTGVQEWTRLVTERPGIALHDAPLVELTARVFSRLVRMRRLLGTVAHRRRLELMTREARRTYIGACQHLCCAPAVPNREVP